MRVSTRLARHDKSAEGVIVPASAVIWYADKAWVYQKQAAKQGQKSGEDHFVRRQINTDSEAGDGWFVAGDLKAGDEVVTNGTQLLLSEEFKDQIKNENDD
jgi:multidrug efflux pump subunit AcrA (membrane-fusion protein)